VDDYWESVRKRVHNAKKSKDYIRGLKRSIRTTSSPTEIVNEVGRPLADLIKHMVCVKAKGAVAFLQDQGTDTSLSSFKKRFGSKAHYRKVLRREVTTIGRGAHVFTYNEVAELVELESLSPPDWL
jgi:hypothetical protein